MGKCSIPRSNPGGGAERIGDIKVTTRTSLGDKWVLCNGDPKEGGEVVTPDITDEQCWTNINGPPRIENYSEGFHIERAIYAGNGIWYSPDENMGHTDLRIYKYDQNTGEAAPVYYESIEDGNFNSGVGFMHLAYDKTSNRLAVIYTNDSSYSDIDTESYDQMFYIILIDCSNYRRINTHNYPYLSCGTVASQIFGDVSVGASKTVWNKDVKCISFNNSKLVFCMNLTLAAGEENLDVGGYENYEEYAAITVLAEVTVDNIMDSLPGTSNLVIENTDFAGNMHRLVDYIEINDAVYALVLIPTGEYNYYKLVRFDTSSDTYTDMSAALVSGGYANNPGEPTISGARLATDGDALYMLVNNDIVRIDTPDHAFVYSEANVAGYSEESEEAKVFFYRNGVFYILCVDGSTYDISSGEAALDHSAFYNYSGTIITSSNEIAKSNCIFTSFTNGTENHYWFNGNDPIVDRWPIITVDEEAYCFMKIKE